MFKQLILSVALLSSTYGATTEYVDPDFSILSDIHTLISIEGDDVILTKGTDHETIISRLNDSIEAQILQSKNPDELANAVTTYALNARYQTAGLHAVIWSDTVRTNNNPLAFANFLREIFWNRIALLSKILQKLLAFPHDTIESETLAACLQINAQLEEFTKNFHSDDTTPFKKEEREAYTRLMNAFSKVHL